MKKTPLARIAKKQKFKISTIINHISQLIDEGDNLDLDYLALPKSKFDKIISALEKCGDGRLRPVYDCLEGKYSYDDIRLGEAIRKARKNK